MQKINALRPGQDRYSGKAGIYSLIDLRVYPEEVKDEALTRGWHEIMSTMHKAKPYELMTPDGKILRFDSWTAAEKYIEMHDQNYKEVPKNEW